LFVNSCPTIQAEELYALVSSSKDIPLDLFILDVREIEEYEFTRIEHSCNISLSQLESKIDTLIKDNFNDKFVVVCRVGQRSEMAANFLIQSGFKNVYNLQGGLISYSKVDKEIKPY
jgi:rhodanese-related sulfurtransferase